MLFQFVFLKQDVNFTYFFGKTSFFIQNTINQAVARSSYMVQVTCFFFFLTNFELFVYLMKHSFECLIKLLKA